METKRGVVDSSLHCSLDTNVLLRWILQDNIEQASLVQKIIEEYKRIHISDIVIAESVWVMRTVYQMDRDDIVEALEIILSLPKFVCNKKLFMNILGDFRSSKSLSFVDLMLVQYAILNNATPLVTFDKKLSKKFDSVELLG